MDYLVCEIKGRQYLIKPNQVVEVDNLNTDKSFTTDKILLWSENGKLEVGQPFVKKSVSFEVLETFKGEKIRVAKFAAKANYRKVRGSRRVITKIKLAEAKSAVKKA